MKKMIFSAVALVAFSFAGMANENIKKESCLDYAIQMVAFDEAEMGCEYSEWDEMEAIDVYLGDCWEY